VIRVYDAAGNVIETHEHAGISKSVDALASDSSRTKSRYDAADDGADSHRRWQQIPELIEPSRITSA
jgi:hypothetical protein